MKILFISTSVMPVNPSGYGGIEALINTFINYFAGSEKHQNDEIIVAAPEGSSLPSNVEHVKTVDVMTHREYDDLAYYRYHDYLPKVDVIHDFSHMKFPARKYTDLPILNMNWDPMIVKYNKPLYNHICLSNWQGNRLKSLYRDFGIKDFKKLELCYDPRLYFYNKGYKKSKWAVYLGKLTKEKGCMELLGMIYDLKDAWIRVMGGKLKSDPAGYGAKVEAACKTHPRFEYWGNVSNSTKAILLREARAMFYYPMQHESHCQAIVEALACGVPCITRGWGAMWEIFQDLAFIPQQDTEADFCMLLDKFFEGDEELKICSDYLAEQAQQRWHPEVVCEEYYELYKKVADGLKW